MTSSVQAAKLIFAPKPEYPPIARSIRVEGEVRMIAIISSEGTIQSLQVLSGHPLLIPATREAVSQWRYQPTILNGTAIEVETEIVAIFRMTN